jgi:hypothetical protein
MFPFNSSLTRRLASLHRIARGSLLRLPRYHQGVPTSCRPFRPTHFSFVWRYHALLRLKRKRGVAVAGSSSELRRCLNPLPSPALVETSRISQVPGQPLREHALLFDPGGPDAPRPLTMHPMLPSVQLTTSAPRSVTFRGSITRPVRSLSTLRGSDYSDDTTQDSLPAGGQPWRGRT